MCTALRSDDPAHRNYTTLANAFRAVVASLPRVNGRNLYLQIGASLCGAHDSCAHMHKFPPCTFLPLRACRRVHGVFNLAPPSLGTCRASPFALCGVLLMVLLLWPGGGAVRCGVVWCGVSGPHVNTYGDRQRYAGGVTLLLSPQMLP